jgi:DNA-binding beta-propeller fold protein YncE
MWVVNEGSNSVMKIRNDGTVLGTFAVGNVPRSIAFDGVNVWISNAYSGDVTKLRVSDGAFLGTYSVGSFPEKIAFDGANIWIANGGSNNVIKR